MKKPAASQNLDEDGNPQPTYAEMRADLHRRIMDWAELWERCPLAGCRRNVRCLHDYDDHCRAVSKEPITDEENEELNRIMRRAIDAEKARRGLNGDEPDSDPPPLYDGNGR